MAITSPSFTITQQDGGQTAIAVNTTTYGGSNEDRNEGAEVVLWSKTSQSGVRSFDNPDQGNVLTNLQYNVNTLIDGWYELIRVRAAFYDAGANYVEQQESGGVITQYASMFYYQTTGKFYKATAASTGQDPDDANYFIEVAVGDLKDNLANTNLDVYYQDWNGVYNVNAAIRDLFTIEVGCCTKDQLQFRQLMLGLLQGANISFSNDNPEDFEKIIRELYTKLSIQ